MTEQPPQKKQSIFSLSKETKSKLKEMSCAFDQSMSEIIEELIDDHYDEYLAAQEEKYLERMNDAEYQSSLNLNTKRWSEHL